MSDFSMEYDDVELSSLTEPLHIQYLRRFLGYTRGYSNGNTYINQTIANVTADDDIFNEDFASKFNAAQDVSVDTVVTSIYLNAFAFLVLMATYEVLRRSMPAVYSSQIKRIYKAGLPQNDDDDSQVDADGSLKMASSFPGMIERTPSLAALDKSLPDIFSFNWVSSVFNVSWSTVRKYSGLDGYFFLRLIRMNLRICAVTSFWAFLILIPVYATGNNQNGEEGWYHFSAANVIKGSARMWIPSFFAYLFTGFIFFVMKQEYRHFLELRMDFLARGSSHVHPQHHYSLLVENIPNDLRSEKALYEYFDKLFPGKVHSANVLLNLPDLEAVKARCARVCRRLEKSIADWHATGKRPTHNVGSPRISILGVDMAPCDCSCGAYPDVAYVDNRDVNRRPARGTHVDSISYYTYDLADCNKRLYTMQQRKSKIAFTGNTSLDAETWLSRLMISANEIADQILVDSANDNALRASHSRVNEAFGIPIPQAELMASRYGSLSQSLPHVTLQADDNFASGSELSASVINSSTSGDSSGKAISNTKTPSAEQLLESSSQIHNKYKYRSPGSQKDHASFIRRLAGRIGLDFVVAIFRFANRQIDTAMEGVVGATMSSTGFVTFLDLTSVTCAVTSPLTSKPQILDVRVAPEPRDVVWSNAHVSAKEILGRERIVNFLLVLGGFFWIFPLAAIQAFAKAEFIARMPGMEWVLRNGNVSNFINGYMPVVALLVLICVLPLIFQLVAIRYERRKTVSEVQASMMGRYFYYQVLNIYVTVTAGSLWRSLAEIVDHPSSLLELLGSSLPSMVGYFVALLVTKILAGLPMVILRVGALSRMLLLRSLTPQAARLSQRELDEVYRPDNVQYGWEVPTQLLVIMIVFTYAVICPVILPVGTCYFCFALIVYKKQVLYVYQPVYESGGSMFPTALQRTLFGLFCGQLTMIGYLFTRGFYHQPIFLLPLPAATIWGTSYFNRHYAEPSTQLSLERAREYDRISEILAESDVAVQLDDMTENDNPVEFGIEGRRTQFKKDAYRQPVLAVKPMMPRQYRWGQPDPMGEECREKLRSLQDYMLMGESNSPESIPSDEENGSSTLS